MTFSLWGEFPAPPSCERVGDTAILLLEKLLFMTKQYLSKRLSIEKRWALESRGAAQTFGRGRAAFLLPFSVVSLFAPINITTILDKSQELAFSSPGSTTSAG